MEVPVDFGNLTTGKKIIAENFANWTSGNEIIDNFIREKQLKYGDVEDNSDDGEAVFEWIPYNELIDIKEIENNCFTKAKLKNGSLHYNRYNKEWIRRPYETVILRSLYDLQNVITEEFANKLESYLTYPVECYGVSQNPDTRVYILVFDNKISNHYCKTCGNEYEGRRYKWCKQCQIDQIKNNFTNWDDRIIKLDDFIQNMQLIINNYNVFKWIPYNEFIIVKELGNYTLAMWKKDRKVYLKHQHNLQENTDEFLNMLGSSVTSKIVIGISQNPNTKVYLSVFNDKYFNKYCEKCGYEYVIDKWCKQCEINQLRNNFINWTSGNVKLDEFIQKMQLNINRSNDIIFEWIPYNEFIIINELENYTLAIWKKGPLYSNYVEKSERNSCVKVYLRNLREITDEVLNEVESYLINKVIFGISQNPDTKVYLLVFHIIYFDRYCEKCGNKYGKYGWCKQCQINQLKNNFTNENVKFNDFIQKMQLMINEYNDRIFEWIPYNEFIISNESENCTLAIWEQDVINSVRKSYEKVYLKHLEITDEFLNKVESFLLNNLVSGISQNPDTKDYILVFNNYYIAHYCLKCENKYDENAYNYWCKSCEINRLKNDFADWTSGNEKIDDFIKKMQLKINRYDDMIFEWIPYNKFIDVKEIRNSVFATAIWKYGPLYYSKIRKNYKRESDEKVLLKYLNNSQNINHTFLNEV
ncbi:hypothetical protein GLOIN_2v438880 [Rhizophagus irregularis DAOM 181602=DAOM 197198]|uniref:Uncharacterized protein n=1 Tax=Rhizophagus irregularis (strain DAOM 181602 / DAOM 197198 / MUCL 43194) TaxID=747089 RepID=A0A2P4PIA4_RHIID|nr:hypothetical protein GLOIN_2v438880 [Rhizophagus irregularis DAOM 181602=DAOM 197198]POG65121.1 hypothetical protein GLOIN_2v438880 [Rhizophagus irregularis DAOM 181602=DAOM 197198]|eukprot:XP_025171987.1 hypothetical protein GLOIN_2v438880 [Rhizophagus irregularis DAOM 181602=DAOM 197198]